MKNFKKIIASFITVISLLALTPVAAQAEWNQTDKGWTYTENGVSKIGWFLDGGKWYYLDNNGIMKRGWIEDKDTWYYLMDDGALDNSKTTTTMPNDVKLIYDIVKPLAQDGNLKYYGLYHINSTYHIQELQDKRLYFFENNDNYGITMNFYIYDPTNGEVYYTNKEGIEVSLVGVGKTDYAINKPITKEQSIQNVENYLIQNQKYVPSKIEVELNDDINYNNVFIIHCYDMISDKDGGGHTATSGWYYVDRSTGNVIKCDIK